MGHGTCRLVDPKILSVLVVIPFQVLSSSTCPSSNGFRLDQRYPRCNYLARTTNKAKEQSTTNQERPRIKRQQNTGRTTTLKEHQRENDLALSADVRSLGQKKQKWLFSLASTSRVDRVNLYGFNKNGIDPISS